MSEKIILTAFTGNKKVLTSYNNSKYQTSFIKIKNFHI